MNNLKAYQLDLEWGGGFIIFAKTKKEAAEYLWSNEQHKLKYHSINSIESYLDRLQEYAITEGEIISFDGDI